MNPKDKEDSDITKMLGIDQSSGKGTGPNRWFMVTILTAVTVIASLFFWKWLGPSAAVHYKTQEVRRGNLTVIVTATGTLEPTNEVDVGIEVSGTIKTVDVDYNDKVKVGQILAKLDTSKLEAQVKQSKASLEGAQAKVLQIQATVSETRIKLAQLRKVQKLSNNKVPSQTEIDAAEAAFERARANESSARAEISQAQATLDLNQTDLSKAAIKSPINGVVLNRNVEPGQTVAASFETPVLFTLAEDLTKMELHVNVDEADVGHIQKGQKATFSVAAHPNRTFNARIIQTRYGSSTTSGVVTYETVLKVDNTALLLRPGMTATADIIVKKIENTVLIPSAALRFTPPIHEEKESSGGLINAILPRPPRFKNQPHDETAGKKEKRIWTLKEGKLSAVWVTIGSANGGMTEVVAGDIHPGMAVVVDTVSSVK
jgi:HlyD family secretion protein